MTQATTIIRERVRYPQITVQLSGQDGNAFAILTRVQCTLRQAGVDRHEIGTFLAEATTGDYNDPLATVMRWVECT
jgi:hypothetical protein